MKGDDSTKDIDGPAEAEQAPDEPTQVEPESADKVTAGSKSEDPETVTPELIEVVPESAEAQQVKAPTEGPVSGKTDAKAPEAKAQEDSSEEGAADEAAVEGEGVGDEQFEQDDPLGPAYDLDGAPLEEDAGREPAGPPWSSKISSAKEFFNTEILYRFDVLEIEERNQLHGTYRLELKGYNGGIWTLSLSEDIEIINRREDADIVFNMDQQDFLHIVNGSLNPQLAMLSQKMRVSGDVRKAVRFERLLAPVME